MTATPVQSSPRLEILDRLLALMPPGRLIDLGAGHGAFSRLAADRGWQVTAVDARTDRWLADSRITWIHQDVRDAELAGQDLILCLGLFYHLTLADQRELLKRCSGTPMIIDTHVCCPANERTKHMPRLSREVSVDGASGRFYDENLSSLLASWVNEKSFWPTVESFYRMLAESGYTVVLATEPWYEPDRTFFLCLPGPPLSTSAASSAFSQAAVRRQNPMLRRFRRTPLGAALATATRPLRLRLRKRREAQR